MTLLSAVQLRWIFRALSLPMIFTSVLHLCEYSATVIDESVCFLWCYFFHLLTIFVCTVSCLHVRVHKLALFVFEHSGAVSVGVVLQFPQGYSTLQVFLDKLCLSYVHMSPQILSSLPSGIPVSSKNIHNTTQQREGKECPANDQ